MIIKFNGGDLCALCSACNKIIYNDLVDYEVKALLKLEETENPDWFCDKCSPGSEKEQRWRIVEIINDFAEEYCRTFRSKLFPNSKTL